MANERNLIPQAHVLTVDEQSRGGKKSAEVRRNKRALRDAIALVMGADITGEEKAELQKIGLSESDYTQQTLIALAIVNRAKKGDLEYVTAIREMTKSEALPTVEMETEAEF